MAHSVGLSTCIHFVNIQEGFFLSLSCYIDTYNYNHYTVSQMAFQFCRSLGLLGSVISENLCYPLIREIKLNFRMADYHQQAKRTYYSLLP